MGKCNTNHLCLPGASAFIAVKFRAATLTRSTGRPPAIVIVLIGMLFSLLTRYPLTHLALDGAAAAAIGLSFSMGITAARRLPPGILPVIVLVGTFVVVGILRWPMAWVLLVAGSLSVAIEYAKLARA